MSNVVHKGREWRKKIRKINREGAHVKVGIFSDGKPRGTDSDLTNAEIGAVHEFGAPDAGIPARPWLKPAIAKNADAYQKFLGRVAQEALQGGSIEKGLAQIGAKAAADVKQYIATGQPPQDLAPATLARKLAKTRKGSKGTPKALIDTAQMLNSITFKVERGDKGE